MNNISKLAKMSKRSAIASLFGLLIIIGSIIFSTISLSDLQNKIAVKQEEYNQISREKIILEDSVKELSDRIRKTMMFDVKRYNIDWRMAKRLSSIQRISTLVGAIESMVYEYNPPWKLGGVSPTEGFDSPSFAAYILIKELKVLNMDFKQRYDLINQLSAESNPRPGDLIFFEGGYTMFYFKDGNHPFCVGMTPLGIASLEMDFGPRIIKYAAIEY